MRVVGSPRAPGPEYHFDYDPTEGDTFELQMLGDHIDNDGESEGTIWLLTRKFNPWVNN
jgi:hypothetical protein